MLLGSEIAQDFSAIKECFDWCLPPNVESWNRKCNVTRKCKSSMALPKINFSSFFFFRCIYVLNVGQIWCGNVKGNMLSLSLSICVCVLLEAWLRSIMYHKKILCKLLLIINCLIVWWDDWGFFSKKRWLRMTEDLIKAQLCLPYAFGPNVTTPSSFSLFSSLKPPLKILLKFV